jgi:hypothetical protein
MCIIYPGECKFLWGHSQEGVLWTEKCITTDINIVYPIHKVFSELKLKMIQRNILA